jgi:hypothetical protein
MAGRRTPGGRRLASSLSAVIAAATLTAVDPGVSRAAVPPAPPWAGFANNAQHTGVAPASPQPLAHVHWHVRVDHNPPTYGDEGGPIAHYGSPMVTGGNTVIVPTRIGPRQGFELVAYAGADGTRKWTLPTDYIVPVGAQDDWPPPIPAGLIDDRHVAVAAAGGTLLVRSGADDATGRIRRISFYGMKQWRAHRAAYRGAVQITTPLTTGADGSVYFGFSATADAPGHLRSGIARISPSGEGSWVAARRLAGVQGTTEVALNCAPALSPVGRTGYVAVVTGTRGRLVGFNATSLRPRYRHRLQDPQTHAPAVVSGSSTATPTVGPDGDVYFGVLGNPLVEHDDRGWLLHFDRHLTTVERPGSFGWDSTVSVVPATSVPSYAGTSSYLLVSKYNNYGLGPRGDGRNEIALLDPHATQMDRFSPARVMREVRTVLSPLHPPDTPAGYRYEWCINSIAVDPVTGSAIANNEDGHLYRWDLDSGQLTESIRLNDPRGQAYTMTEIGPDGTSYAIENAILYAVGS